MPGKVKINRLYWTLHFLIACYMRTLGRLRVIGRENIPLNGGLIIAANHVAGADPFLLGSAVPRELWFMAKKELFESALLGRFIARVNAFPVDRFNFDIDVIRKSISFLREGKVLIMFPEGTRSKDGQIKEAKTGVGMLAKKAGVAIVPVYLQNTRKAWWNFIEGKRMIIAFGPPLSADWIKSRPPGKAGYREITDELMRRIVNLKRQVGGN